jgi:hypothetical protein
MTNRTGLLDHVARGVHALACRDGSGPSVPPYPEDTQYALDLVVRECLHLGLTPPAGVPELIRWCANLGWPFPFEECAGLALVDPVHRTRTRACAELAGLATVADELVAGALSDVTAAEAVERRRFLRSHVLVGPDTHRELLMSDPSAASVFKFVKDLYQPISAEWIVRGRVALCECGLPARPGSPDDGFIEWCERETCSPGSRVVRRLSAGRALMLHPALRLFVALPARAEDRLRRVLVAGGLSMEQAAGRHVVGLSGEILRYYDRIVPTALARDAVADQVDIAVVPDGSTMAGPACRRTFSDALPPGVQITLVTDAELLADVTSDRRTSDA